MLLYKNGRFHANGVSFSLPDGFYLEADMEGIYECALSAWSPDKNIRFTWEIYKDDEDSMEALRSYVAPQTGYRPLTDITVLKVNRLEGLALFYRGERVQIFEARFAIPSGGCFAFGAEVKDESILRLYETEVFKAALSGIDLDNE